MSSLLQILNFKSNIRELSKLSRIPIDRLNYYEKHYKYPLGSDLENICGLFRISPSYLKARMGIVDRSVTDYFKNNLESDFSRGDQTIVSSPDNRGNVYKSVFHTKLGRLYRGDCVTLMKSMKSETVDVIFADPPFNLNKSYLSKINDNLGPRDYLDWCREWCYECARLLKYGGSMFIWNLPKWNVFLGSYLAGFMTFRHQIAVDIKCSFPIAGRLFPSHYSLLYFCKGNKPTTFHPDRLPLEICDSCKGDIHDYGGYKNMMNPKGVNLTDVWLDIPPVRHAKYKKRKEANELSIKLLDRIIEMSSNCKDVIFDPFGGSGTTYIVSELKKRKWLGIEMGPIGGIVRRFRKIRSEKDYLDNIRSKYNRLFSTKSIAERNKRHIWTHLSIKKK